MVAQIGFINYNGLRFHFSISISFFLVSVFVPVVPIVAPGIPPYNGSALSVPVFRILSHGQSDRISLSNGESQ